MSLLQLKLFNVKQIFMQITVLIVALSLLGFY
jgi:hypothetical protein